MNLTHLKGLSISLVVAFIPIDWTSRMYFTPRFLTKVRSGHHVSGVLNVGRQLRCSGIIPAITTKIFSKRRVGSDGLDTIPRHHIPDTAKNRQMSLWVRNEDYWHCDDGHGWYFHSKTHNICTQLWFVLSCCGSIGSYLWAFIIRISWSTRSGSLTLMCELLSNNEVSQEFMGKIGHPVPSVFINRY